LPPENLVDPKLEDDWPPVPPVVVLEKAPPAANTPVAVDVGAVLAVGLNHVVPPFAPYPPPAPMETKTLCPGLNVKKPSVLVEAA
jgi:hypothetical protein